MEREARGTVLVEAFAAISLLRVFSGKRYRISVLPLVDGVHATCLTSSAVRQAGITLPAGSHGPRQQVERSPPAGYRHHPDADFYTVGLGEGVRITSTNRVMTMEVVIIQTHVAHARIGLVAPDELLFTFLKPEEALNEGYVLPPLKTDLSSVSP